jgi:hypothetical protein
MDGSLLIYNALGPKDLRLVGMAPRSVKIANAVGGGGARPGLRGKLGRFFAGTAIAVQPAGTSLRTNELAAIIVASDVDVVAENGPARLRSCANGAHDEVRSRRRFWWQRELRSDRQSDARPRANRGIWMNIDERHNLKQLSCNLKCNSSGSSKPSRSLSTNDPLKLIDSKRRKTFRPPTAEGPPLAIANP